MGVNTGTHEIGQNEEMKMCKRKMLSFDYIPVCSPFHVIHTYTHIYIRFIVDTQLGTYRPCSYFHFLKKKTRAKSRKNVDQAFPSETVQMA